MGSSSRKIITADAKNMWRERLRLTVTSSWDESRASMRLRQSGCRFPIGSRAAEYVMVLSWNTSIDVAVVVVDVKKIEPDFV